jgi:hypothetical protein
VAAAADVWTGQHGESGPGSQHRQADHALAPARLLPTSEAIVDALLPGHVTPGREPRAGAGGTMLPQGPAAVVDHEAAVADQLVQAIRVRAGEGTGEARLRLNPEFLGEVRIEVKISGDRVSAVLHVERDDVRQQIESGTPALRAALAAHGLDLDEVTVRDDDSSKREGSSQDRREPRERRRRDQPAGTFELPE